MQEQTYQEGLYDYISLRFNNLEGFARILCDFLDQPFEELDPTTTRKAPWVLLASIESARREVMTALDAHCKALGGQPQLEISHAETGGIVAAHADVKRKGV